MLKPSVQIHRVEGFPLAEFWDCLRLDPAPVRDLRAGYERHLLEGGRAELIVDLMGVEFAGSAALGGFVALNRLARQNDGRLIFCRVEPTVAHAFRLSKLDKLFDFAVDRDAALAAAKLGPSGNSNGARPVAESPEPGLQPGSLASPAGPGRLRRARPTTDLDD